MSHHDVVPGARPRIITVGIQGPPGAGGSSKAYVDAGDTGSRQRANHTGTQPSSTISDFANAVDARVSIQKSVANGLATLGSDNKIPSVQLPALAITDTFPVASQTAMLALSAEVGDVAVRTDLGKSFILRVAGASTLSNWQELMTPTDAVLSVNGQTGTVALTAASLGAAAAVHTHPQSDVAGLGSTLAQKAPLDSPELTGTPTAPTPPPGTNSNRIATTAYADTAVAALVSSAPGVLDTLNELAAALGNDPNFATTVTTSLADRVVGPVSATDNELVRFNSTSGKLVQGSGLTVADSGTVTFPVNAKINLSSNTPSGGITRSIQFTMNNEFDRPWLAWVDEAGRHRACTGYHSTDYNTGLPHDRYEIKTSNDPLAADPSLLLTRFYVETDKDFTDASFGYLDTLNLSRTVYQQDHKFGQAWVIPDSAGTARSITSIKSFLASPNDDTITELDVLPVTSSKAVGLRFFRSTNTSGGRSITIFKGDGSGTQSIVIDANTGGVGLKSTSGLSTGGLTFGSDTTLYRSAADTLKTDDAFLAIGTITGPLRDKAGQVHNVKAYGAKGDGSTDDTAAVQLALDACDIAGGGMVYFPAATYILGVLYISSNTTVDGTGTSSVLKLKNSTNDYMFKLRNTAASPTSYTHDQQFRNVYFDGNNANNTTAAGFIYGVRSRNLTVERCRMEYFKGKCIYLVGSAGNNIQPRILNNQFDLGDRSDGVCLFLDYGCYDSHINRNDFGRAWYGMVVSNGGNGNHTITDNQFWGNENMGLQIYQSHNNMLTGNTFDRNFGNGCEVDGSNNNTFVNNKFSNNSFDDIAGEFGYGAGYGTANVGSGARVLNGSTNIRFIGCNFSNPDSCQKYGIVSEGSSQVYYSNTTFSSMVTGNISTITSGTVTSLDGGSSSSPTFAGLNLGSGSLSTVGNIALDGTAARDMTMARAASGAGLGLTISAGGAQGGGSNQFGGNLQLTAGIGTGNATGSRLQVNVSPPGSTGTSDQSSHTSLILLKTSAASRTGIQLILSDTTVGGVTGINLSGNTAQTLQLVRHSTANTAGNSLTVTSGGATLSATDKAAGDLILSPGLSTGIGPSKVRIQTNTTATATGTGDNTATDRIIVTSPKGLTNNSATSILSLTLAPGSMIGGVITYTIEVTSGAEYQVETGQVIVSGYNKAGVFGVTVTKANSQQNLSTGTLSTTWALSSANPAVISINANSSLTPSTGYPRITFTYENYGQQAVTIL